MAEQRHVSTLSNKGGSVITVSRDIGVSLDIINRLKRSAAILPHAMIPIMKSDCGAPKKTSPILFDYSRGSLMLCHFLPPRYFG